MKWQWSHPEGRDFLPLLCAVTLWLLLSPGVARGATMKNYCNEPPLPGANSNVLLLLDNSGSAYDAAYSDPATYCLDNNYQNSQVYRGYFDRNKIYSYDFANGRFQGGATLPSPGSCSGACAALTDYLYVEMAGTAPWRNVSSFIATGNFLNWLATSKLDVEKQVLTGGKFVADSADPTRQRGVLVGETRGCDGKRIVKMIGDTAKITFAVRSQGLSDPGYVFRATHGGETYIEIYDKPYNKVPCLKAVEAWRRSDFIELKKQVDLCLDVKVEPIKNGAGTMISAAAIYNHIMTDCYQFLAQGLPPTTLMGNDPELVSQCLQRYAGVFSGQADSNVNLLNTLEGVCGRGQKHVAALGGNSGYIGQCYLPGGSWLSNCLEKQITDYCNQIKKPTLIDPSSMGNLTGLNSNLPAFVLDAGVSNLGDASGKFRARVLVDSPPTGVIQEFSDRINFGAMAFNLTGASAPECLGSAMECVKYCSNNTSIMCSKSLDCGLRPCTPGKEGARVISYINDPASPLGDHSSGLIAAIDQLEPTAWTPYAEAFYNAIGYFAGRSALRLDAGDFDILAKPAPSAYSCQRNNVLIVSDGMSTADGNAAVEGLASLYSAQVKAATGKSETGKDTANSCPVYDGSRSLDDLAWIAAHRNIKSFSTSLTPSTDTPASASQSITTHVIFTGSSNGAQGQCDPAVLMKDTAANGGGSYEQVADPAALYGKFVEMLRRIAGGTSSGTGASLVSTGEGNGAVFLQERFYPVKTFDGGATRASWVGEMDSLWYYIDPFLGNGAGSGSTLREDCDGNKKLTLAGDRMISYRYDATDGRSRAYLSSDTNGDGIGEGTEEGPVDIEDLKTLWRTGRQLWSRDVTASPRTIYTPAVDAATELPGTGLMKFVSLTANVDALKPYLNVQQGDPEAGRVIDYLQGVDYPLDPSMRSRKVTIAPAAPPTEADLAAGRGVWKLGDIISSTPKVQSAVPLASYHLAPPKGYGESSYSDFIGSSGYQGRGMVYVGANDGMIHAFNFGSLKTPGAGEVKASLEGTGLGREEWAFIPRNVLPYLKYLTLPNYRHLYLVDGSLTLADLDLGSGTNPWRTVLLGGMGLGGASARSCAAGSNCVATPAGDLGYSSYFALDVTDPANPSLLWEFSDPLLGYATSGAALVRAGGKWYAVFGSGPTGPIDENACRFKGNSDQKLQLFVVDMQASGGWSLGNNYWVIDTGITKTFAGSLSGGAVDVDVKVSMEKAQDDALYLGYVRSDGSGNWNQGGVLRLLVKDGPKPAQNTDAAKDWSASKVIDGIGPVTSGIARLVDRRAGKLWLYFGTGRYSYLGDDFGGQRHLFGVQDRCYAKGLTADQNYLDRSCDLTVVPGPDPENTGKGGVLGFGELKKVDPGAVKTDLSGNYQGWYLPLDAAGAGLGAERSVTDPLALTSGQVVFATFQPSETPCLPDTSYLWRVSYDSADPVPAGAVRGKILAQLSTGGAEQSDLSGVLSGRGNRRGAAMTGRPAGLKAVSNSGLRPLRRIIHIQER